MPKKGKQKNSQPIVVNGVPKKLPSHLQKRGNVQKKKKKQKGQHTKSNTGVFEPQTIAKQNYQESMATVDDLTHNNSNNNNNNNNDKNSENESDNNNEDSNENNSYDSNEENSNDDNSNSNSKNNDNNNDDNNNNNKKKNRHGNGKINKKNNKNGNSMINENDKDDDYVSSDTSAEWFDGDEDSDSKAYGPGGYLRVRVGDLLNQRYLVEEKLGWGHFSTVWLAIDKLCPESDERHRYVALKIQKSAQHYYEAAQDEIELLTAAKEDSQKNRKEKKSDENNGISRASYIAQMFDSFEVKAENGNHIVFVFEVLGTNLLDLIKAYNYRGLPIAVVKKIAREVLIGLDYLHSECNIIHTDLKPENVLMTRTEPICMTQLARSKRVSYKNQFSRQCARLEKQLEMTKNSKQFTKLQKQKLTKKINEFKSKIANLEEEIMNDEIRRKEEKELKKKEKIERMNRVLLERKENENNENNDSNDENNQKVIANENDLTLLFEYIHGWSVERNMKYSQLSEEVPREPIAKIADLGNACWINKHFTDDITTRQYRAPESIMGQEYDCGVDVWSHACLIFELLTGDYLFDPREDTKHRYSRDEDHLALISELCGKFPYKLTQYGRHCQTFFDKNGDLKNIKKLDYWPLVEVLKEKYKMPRKDAKICSNFLGQMLEIDPRKRASAKEMLSHKWLVITEEDRYNCYKAEKRWLMANGKPTTDTNANYDSNGQLVEHSQSHSMVDDVNDADDVNDVDDSQSDGFDGLKNRNGHKHGNERGNESGDGRDDSGDSGHSGEGTTESEESIDDFENVLHSRDSSLSRRNEMRMSFSAPPPSFHRYCGIKWYDQFEMDTMEIGSNENDRKSNKNSNSNKNKNNNHKNMVGFNHDSDADIEDDESDDNDDNDDNDDMDEESGVGINGMSEEMYSKIRNMKIDSNGKDSSILANLTKNNGNENGNENENENDNSNDNNNDKGMNDFEGKMLSMDGSEDMQYIINSIENDNSKYQNGKQKKHTRNESNVSLSESQSKSMIDID